MTEARQLAASRRHGGPAIAILLAVSSWADAARSGPAGTPAASAQPGGTPRPDETAAAAAVLRAAGWRVTSVDAATPLGVAWQRIPRIAGAPGLAPGAMRRPEAVG